MELFLCLVWVHPVESCKPRAADNGTLSTLAIIARDRRERLERNLRGLRAVRWSFSLPVLIIRCPWQQCESVSRASEATASPDVTGRMLAYFMRREATRRCLASNLGTGTLIWPRDKLIATLREDERFFGAAQTDIKKHDDH